MSSNITKFSLLTVSILCLILMFVSGPGYYDTRSFKAAWELGHIFSFALWTFVIIRYWHLPAELGFVKQASIVLITALIVGILIELIQSVVGRSAQLHDIYRDIVGSAFALIFFLPSRKLMLRTKLHLLQIIVLVLIMLEMLPLSIAVADEMIAKQQFPLLADFETPFEENRVDRENSARCDQVARKGKHSLKVQLTTEKYSGTGLKYFPNDWSAYGFLNFSVNIPVEDGLKLTCRVNDSQHDQKYKDRFNRSFDMKTGWNDIKIPLQEIADAPADRKMDLTHIQSLGIFAVELPAPRIIYLDNIYLSRS